MSRTVDYIFKGHDGVTPAIRKMLREQKRFNAAAKGGINTLRRGAANTAGWLKRELNLRQQINSTAARYVGAAAIVGFGVIAIKEHAKLEDAMFKVKQRTGESEKAVEGYRNMIQDLAVQTGQSAPLIAEAMAEFAGAGDDITTSYEKAKVAAMGAAIAQTDVATIASGMQPIMAAWNVESERSTEIMAKMIVAADAGTVELDNLSGVIGDLTGPASQANASIEEVLAGIEALSVSGVSNANEASTAFSRMMESLSKGKVQENFSKAAKRMGKDISFVDAEGNMRGLADNLGQIHSIWMTLDTDTKRNSFVEAVWGSDIRVKRALLPILNNFEKYKEILEEIEGATPEQVIKLLEDQADRTSIKLAKLNQQFRVLGADTGAMLEPALTLLVDKMNELRTISEKGETAKGKGALGGLERLAFTQEALGGGKLGGLLAADVAIIDAALSLVTERRLGFAIRKKKGRLTPSEERAEAAQAARGKAPGRGAADVWLADRLGKDALPGLTVPTIKDFQATGQVNASGPLTAQGPLRSTGQATILGPVTFTGPVNLKAPQNVDGT